MKILLIVYFILFTTTLAQDIQYPERTPEDPLSFYQSCQESIVNKTGNPFCKCKVNTAWRYLNNQFVVSPVCLPTTVTSKGGGGIFGNIGGRVLWTYANENTNTGAPLEIETAVIDATTIVVTWSEDQGGFSFDKSRARTHITEINIAGVAVVKRDIVLQGCLMNGGVVYNKINGNIVTLCAKYCVGCPAGALDMHIVEVNFKTFLKVQDYSVMFPECKASNQFCFQGVSGTAFRYLKYDPVNDRYAVSHNSGWGGHVADSVVIVDAKTRKVIPGGYQWACGTGHTSGVKIGYNSKAPGGFVQVCTTDVQSFGLVYNQLVPKKLVTKLAPQRIWFPQASITWPGSIVSCGDYIYVSWHGVKTDNLPIKKDGKPDTLAEEIDVAFARIVASTGVVEKIVWMTNGDGRRHKNAKIAPLSSTCSSFLFGWGESEVGSTELYPSKYYVVEIDKNGNKLKPVQRVDQFSIWYEDTEWVPLANGGVVWSTTWRRLKTNGQPRHMPLEFDGYMNTNGYKGATYSAHGYGFMWDPVSEPYTQRFKTNELFISVYKTSAVSYGNLYVPPSSTIISSNYCRVVGDDRFYYSKILQFYNTFSCVNNKWNNTGSKGGFGFGRCMDSTSGSVQLYLSGKVYKLGDGSVKLCGNGGYDYNWTTAPAGSKPVNTLEVDDQLLMMDD